MKKVFLGLSLALTTLFGLTGCETEESASVDQDRIRGDYELFYDKNTNKTTAIAVFRFGTATGTQLTLSDPAQVKFNNDVLLLNTTLGRYEKTYDALISSGTFVYTDTKGTVLTNASPAIKPAEFTADPLNLSKAAASTTITWQGDPLAQNENIGLLILGTAAGALQNTAGATSLTIGGAQIQPVNAGPYVAVMDRATVLPLTQQTSAGGSITAKHRSLNKSVQVSN